MFPLTVLAFLIAAAFGATIAYRHIRDDHIPLSLGLAHGFVAIAGLVLLSYGIFMANFDGNAKLALVIFMLAAGGGAILFNRQFKGRRMPGGLIFAHAGAALVALSLLILTLLDL